MTATTDEKAKAAFYFDSLSLAVADFSRPLDRKTEAAMAGMMRYVETDPARKSEMVEYFSKLAKKQPVTAGGHLFRQN